MWISRNEEMHNRPDQKQSKQEHRIRTRVQETYYDPQSIRDTLFHLPLEERLEQDRFQFVKWLETVEQAQLSTTEGGMH